VPVLPCVLAARRVCLVAAVLLGLAWPASADPVRIVVLSRYSEALASAAEAFRAKYGEGLIALELGESTVAPDAVRSADVVFAHYMSAQVFARVAPGVKVAIGRGATALAVPPDNLERQWGVKGSPRQVDSATAYWQAGGTDNLTSFLAMLYVAGGGTRRIDVPAPTDALSTGLYHPRAGRPFQSLDEYLRWYRAQRLVPDDAPLVAIPFFSNNFKFHDLGAIDALVARLEREGIGAVPAFGWPLSTLRPLLTSNGASPIRGFMAFSLGFTQSADLSEFERYGVPVMNMLTSRQSAAEWAASDQGITSDRVSTQLNSPERAGANEPTLVATTEKVEGSDATRTQPVAERVDAAVRRMKRWLTLQQKANAEKRIAFVYFSTPPGKGYLGASYLNLMPSLVNLVGRLRDEGYSVGRDVPDEAALIDLLTRTGRNIEQWAPGELADMARLATLVPVTKYRRWYAQLPRDFRAAVEKVWGPPERSQLMTVVGADGTKSIVVPGLRLGNVFLGPQPLRTTYERAVDLQHDTLTPPPHSYIAAYLWYRYEFLADAVVHMGRHGTLEWLPGKHVGQAGADDSEAILGDLPNPYYFIIDGGGEAIQARRRSAGVMIGHLTPLVVSGGLQAEHQPLRDALDGYEAASGVAPEVADEYRAQILTAVRDLKLDGQLGIDLDALPWGQIFDTVAEFARDAAEGPTPLGQHTIGSAPADHVTRDGLEEFIRTAFQPDERKALAAEIRRWTEAVFDGDTPEAAPSLPRALHDKAARAIADAAVWVDAIRRSPAMELDAIVRVLGGGFITSAPLGDPLRSPASIPSGRNLHDLDTALIPTKAAWEVGKRLAEQQVTRFKADTGRTLEKLSMVLWYGETARSRGVMESEALWLMGVEPRWNARNVVDGLRLVPEAELGRPRVDVVYTVSGIYRDGFGDKILWLDRAARLAASAGDNAISRHDREVKTALMKNGVPELRAEQAATARVFGAAPGMYGVGGIEQIVSRSLDDGEEKGIADMYLHHMNHAYSEKVWGAEVGDTLAEQLKGNDALVHSRTTYVYGALDNDDFYQFAGGLNAALKAVNGTAPQFYVNNQRADGHERIESFRRFLVGELTTRYWNPKWIKEQQAAGYAGARQIIKEMEHLYGFQATSKEQVDGQLWQKSYDVYVADEHGLDMDAFFEKANPYVRQWQLARLLEVDRQGSYRFSDAERGVLIDKYVSSVVAHGAACSSNTCGNLRLHQYIAEQAPLVSGLGAQDLQAFARQMTKATHWGTQQFTGAPEAFRSGIVEGLRQVRDAARASAPPPPPLPPPAPPPATELPMVTGARMEEKVLRIAGTSRGQLAGTSLPLLGIGCLIAVGVVRGWRARQAA